MTVVKFTKRPPVKPTEPEETFEQMLLRRPEMRVVPLITVGEALEGAAQQLLNSERDKLPPVTLENLRRWLDGEPSNATADEATDAQEGGDE